jgi:hypothetical protein
VALAASLWPAGPHSTFAPCIEVVFLGRRGLQEAMLLSRRAASVRLPARTSASDLDTDTLWHATTTYSGDAD